MVVDVLIEVVALIVDYLPVVGMVVVSYAAALVVLVGYAFVLVIVCDMSVSIKTAWDRCSRWLRSMLTM